MKTKTDKWMDAITDSMPMSQIDYNNTRAILVEAMKEAESDMKKRCAYQASKYDADATAITIYSAIKKLGTGVK